MTMMEISTIYFHFILFDLPEEFGCKAGVTSLRSVLPNHISKVLTREGFHGEVKTNQTDFPTMKSISTWYDGVKSQFTHFPEKNTFYVIVGGNHLSLRPVLEQFFNIPGSQYVGFDAHVDSGFLAYNQENDWETAGSWLINFPNPHCNNGWLLGTRVREYQKAPDWLRIIVEPRSQSMISAWKEHVEPNFQNEKPFIIDLDFDVFPPHQFPAVYSRTFGGLHLQDTWDLLLLLSKKENCTGICYSGFVPSLDNAGLSLDCIRALTIKIICNRLGIS